MFATSASCGSVGSGAQSSACRLSSAVLRVSAGLHWSLSMSRQMAPVWELMFGCQTSYNDEKRRMIMHCTVVCKVQRRVAYLW